MHVFYWVAGVGTVLLRSEPVHPVFYHHHPCDGSPNSGHRITMITVVQAQRHNEFASESQTSNESAESAISADIYAKGSYRPGKGLKLHGSFLLTQTHCSLALSIEITAFIMSPVFGTLHLIHLSYGYLILYRSLESTHRAHSHRDTH